MTKQVITTSDVAIKQVEISIKVMKIGNRQVTQAVFKQLPEEQIIDYSTGKLRGLPWGRVNYHPDLSCKDTVSHFHVVWQKDNILCRAAIENRWKHPILPSEVEDIEASPLFVLIAKIEYFLLARILEGWHPDKKTRSISIPIDDVPFVVSLDQLVEVDSVLEKVHEYKEHLKHYEYWEKQYRECPNDSYWAGHIAAERETHQEKAQQFDAFRKGIADRLQVAFTSTSSDILYQNHLLPAMTDLYLFKETWQQSYEQLQQLDQLFIAV